MFASLFGKKATMVTAESALKGRDAPMEGVPQTHHVNGHPLKGPWPEGFEIATFGLGCFWGAERKFWNTEGVYSTSVGYLGGFTKNPTYKEVCSGSTGHNEVVQVVFDPNLISFAKLVAVFFESHDPTQGMRQGNDVGTQYRSGIYVHDDSQRRVADTAMRAYQARLDQAGFSEITTEVVAAGPYYYAEEYHQQYLSKNPAGYCGIGGTGVSCPIGLAVEG